MLFLKLRRYLRQHHIGLLALFVALGGSAYAAAKIKSSNVVDNSLTGADVRGREASGKKKFTQGSLTGADIRGSAAAGGRPAVDGSLTGDDLKDGSLGGGDVQDGSLSGADVQDGSLTPADLMDESLTGLDVLESSLGPVPKAADADTVGGRDPQSFASAVRTNQQKTSTCDLADVLNECAPVTITVPAGRNYRAVVWSSLSAGYIGSGVINVEYCAGIRNVSSSGPKTCLTPSGVPNSSFALNSPADGGSGATSGDTSQLNLELGPGTWTFSTMVQPDEEVFAGAGSDVYQVHTTVMISDANAPSLPGVPANACCTTATSSSGTTSGSSGTTGNGSSGTTTGNGSSGTTSGSSGTTTGG